MTAAELQALLEPLGIRPIKGRSQHFLLDESVVEAMCAAAGVTVGTRVLEIGPGPGILTDALLRRGAEVVAAELDMKLCALLRERFTSPKFVLREGDALRTPNSEFAAAFPSSSAEATSAKGGESGAGEYMLVANLPYAITSAILQKFLLEAPEPERIVIMIQKEVADRLMAKPGDMGSLSVLAQSYAKISRVRDVPPGAFLPPPKVDSTVVMLKRKSDTLLSDLFGPKGEKHYFSLVQAAFSSPRKQLKNTLRAVEPDAEKLEKALIKAKISPSARPETLSVEDWGRLAREI